MASGKLRQDINTSTYKVTRSNVCRFGQDINTSTYKVIRSNVCKCSVANKNVTLDNKGIRDFER